jgi:hypothetical protein
LIFFGFLCVQFLQLLFREFLQFGAGREMARMLHRPIGPSQARAVSQTGRAGL